jgi:hypothetical protein
MRFEAGSAAGHRLLAPGLPDVMVATEQATGWLNDSGLWIQAHGVLTLHGQANVSGLQASGEHWVVVTEQDGSSEVQRISTLPSRACERRTFQGRSVVAGTDWVVVDTGIERVAFDLLSGEVCRLPVGARDSRPQPWASGCGVIWVDQGRVYRLSGEERPQVVGVLAWTPKAWLAGPHGSAVFCGANEAYGLAAGGTLVQLPLCDSESVRFSDDGLEALVLTEDALCSIQLSTGDVTLKKQGALSPVGFCNGPVVLDEDSGVLKALGGMPISDGYSPCAAAHMNGTLYGPGGTAWDVTTGRRLWRNAPLAGTHLVAHPEGVVQIDPRIRGFNNSGEPVFDFPIPTDEEIDGEVLDACWVEDMLYLEVDHGWIKVDFTGKRVGVVDEFSPPNDCSPSLDGWSFDDESGCISREGEEFPLRVVGVLQHEGYLWCWNDDGMLLVLNGASGAL